MLSLIIFKITKESTTTEKKKKEDIFPCFEWSRRSIWSCFDLVLLAKPDTLPTPGGWLGSKHQLTLCPLPWGSGEGEKVTDQTGVPACNLQTKSWFLACDLVKLELDFNHTPIAILIQLHFFHLSENVIWKEKALRIREGQRCFFF